MIIGYEEANRRGFHIVDADIQFTKDNIPVIFHGKELDTIINGNGILSSKTLYELQKLDFGNEQFKGQKILTFENLLKFCKKNKLIIDLIKLINI